MFITAKIMPKTWEKARQRGKAFEANIFYMFHEKVLYGNRTIRIESKERVK